MGFPYPRYPTPYGAELQPLTHCTVRRRSLMESEDGAGSEVTGMIERCSPVLGSEDEFGSPMSSPRRHSTRVRIAQRFLCFVL
eukprot:COSAG02_NODE_4129_length_5740_cov_11.843290_1_plen_83_part_00